MRSAYRPSQNLIASNYEWVSDSPNANLSYSERATEISHQTIMTSINNGPYLYLYRNEMTQQNNNITATLTNRYDQKLGSLLTNNVLFETAEQIQAVIGTEGLRKLRRIVQSRRKTLSENELGELASNFANWDC